MKKAIFVLLPAVLLLSGCQALRPGNAVTEGGLIKSVDGGQSWEQKSNVEAQPDSITIADSLAIAIDPKDSKNIFLGTRAMGIFASSSAADSWTQIDFPPVKTYGIAINPSNSQEIYASGVWQNRGKIYKSTDGAKTWKEIYTEPSVGTVVTSLAISRNNPQRILAGLSTGEVVRSNDGGGQWSNVFRADGAVTAIMFTYGSDEKVYFVVKGKGLLRSDNGGDSGRQLTVQTVNSRGIQIDVNDINSIAVDPNFVDIVYIGTTSSGLLRGIKFGEAWETLNTLSNPERFPVTAIAVSPANPNEIVYSAAQAIYKTTNGGREWSTFQLDISNAVKILQYDPNDPNVIYGGIGRADTGK